jgi:hypothetical protein
MQKGRKVRDNNDDKDKMKRFLSTFILIGVTLISSVSWAQYPIQTIFKGDSVVILTLKQSDDINTLIDEQAILIELYERQIDVLNMKIGAMNKELTKMDSVASYHRSISDSVGKENVTLMDSIWNWSLGPSLIYSQYPDDSTMYILDLSRYYLTTDDYGIIMVRMTDKEFDKYISHIKATKENPPTFKEFDNSSEFEYINKDKIRRRKVWKYRLKQ